MKMNNKQNKKIRDYEILLTFVLLGWSLLFFTANINSPLIGYASAGFDFSADVYQPTPPPINVSINISIIDFNVNLSWNSTVETDGYMIWYSSNSSKMMSLEGNFLTIQPNITLNNTTLSWYDPESSNISRRFYRVAAFKNYSGNVIIVGYASETFGKVDININGTKNYGIGIAEETRINTGDLSSFGIPLKISSWQIHNNEPFQAEINSSLSTLYKLVNTTFVKCDYFSDYG